MEVLNRVTQAILAVLALCVAFKVVYVLIGVFSRSKKYPETDERRKFAIIISARNEETVIGNLIKSLLRQNYPKNLISIFVVADNCDDKTAEISRSLGAIVYERFDKAKARKGWALEFLFENIEKDFGIKTFDNYIFFDADNIVDANYVHEMNKAVASGAKAVVGYRNTKNFSTNFISAAYGMHFCRTTCNYLRASSVIGASGHIAGTGFCLSNEILKDGWHYHSLTEDSELTTDLIVSGEIVHYCEKAQFYDEQPTNLVVSWRQRMRWVRGTLTVFIKRGGDLLKNLFKRNVKPKSRWSSYEMFWYLFPYALFTLVIGAIYPITSTIISLAAGNPLPWLDWLKGLGMAAVSFYLTAFLEGALVLIREHKHIKCHWFKRICMLFLWPWYDLLSLPLLVCACFVPVKWTPIVHKDQTKIEEIESFGKEQEQVIEIDEEDEIVK